MAKDKAMADRVDVGGHYAATKAPSLNKGQFQQVGTFIDEGDMNTVMPRGISVNSKSGTMQTGEKP